MLEHELYIQNAHFVSKKSDERIRKILIQNFICNEKYYGAFLFTFSIAA